MAADAGGKVVDQVERFLALRLQHKLPQAVRFGFDGAINERPDGVAVAEQVGSMKNQGAAVALAGHGLVVSDDEAMRAMAQLMSPMTPHLAEEVWAMLGGDGLVAQAPWPKADPAMLVEDTVLLPIQSAQTNAQTMATLALFLILRTMPGQIIRINLVCRRAAWNAVSFIRPVPKIDEFTALGTKRPKRVAGAPGDTGLAVRTGNDARRLGLLAHRVAAISR